MGSSAAHVKPEPAWHQDRLLVIGLPGTGKTVLILRWLLEAASQGRRIWIIDVFRSYTFAHTYTSIAAFNRARQVYGGTPRVVSFQPPAGVSSSRARELAFEVLELVEREGGTVVMDELYFLVDPQKKIPDAVARIAFAGRKVPAVSYIAGAQYATQIHHGLRRTASRIYLFQQTDEADLEWIRRIGGVHAEDYARRAPHLVFDERYGEYIPIDKLRPPPHPAASVRIRFVPSDFAYRRRG